MCKHDVIHRNRKYATYRYRDALTRVTCTKYSVKSGHVVLAPEIRMYANGQRDTLIAIFRSRTGGRSN